MSTRARGLLIESTGEVDALPARSRASCDDGDHVLTTGRDVPPLDSHPKTSIPIGTGSATKDASTTPAAKSLFFGVTA